MDFDLQDQDQSDLAKNGYIESQLLASFPDLTRFLR